MFKSNHHICRNTCVNSSLLGLYKVVYEVLEGSYVSIDPEMITFFDILMRKIEEIHLISLMRTQMMRKLKMLSTVAMYTPMLW